MNMSSISPQPKTKPKFPFRFIVLFNEIPLKFCLYLRLVFQEQCVRVTTWTQGNPFFIIHGFALCSDFYIYSLFIQMPGYTWKWMMEPQRNFTLLKQKNHLKRQIISVSMKEQCCLNLKAQYIYKYILGQ